MFHTIAQQLCQLELQIRFARAKKRCNDALYRDREINAFLITMTGQENVKHLPTRTGAGRANG